MGNRFMLCDGEVREVRLVRRPDGWFEDALSGTVYTPEQIARVSFFLSREAALQAKVAQEATPGYLSPFRPYSEKSASPSPVGKASTLGGA